MNPGSRRWIKLWVDPWLSGTMRFTLDHRQRAVWADLLALGGQSRVPGAICAGEENGKIIGFPLSRIAGFVDIPDLIELEAMLNLFAKQERISIEHEHGRVIIRISNWSKYQAEYSKQARYKAKKKQEKERGYPHGYPKVTQVATGGGYQKATSLEVEGEVEGEDKNIRASHDVKPAVSRDSLPSKTDPEYSKAIAEIWDSYLQTMQKNPKVLSFTDQRKKKGMARLREALAKTGGDMERAVGLLRCAIDAMAASPWHMGENPSKKRYDSWESNLFKSQEQFEGWLQRSIDGEGGE